LFGSSNFLFEIDNIATPIPIIKKTKYGASFPKNCEIRPAVIGPDAHPIPKVVSYAPIIVPEIARRVLVRIISSVNGKNILNPNPSKINAIANSIIVSTKNDIPNPIDIENIAIINVKLVFLANFPATASVIIREIPNTKKRISISTTVMALSFRNAG